MNDEDIKPGECYETVAGDVIMPIRLSAAGWQCVYYDAIKGWAYRSGVITINDFKREVDDPEKTNNPLSSHTYNELCKEMGIELDDNDK